MLTILEKSVSDLRIKRGFHTLRWKSSNNLSNTLTETFWRIRTPFRKHTFIQYLQIKVLLGYASMTETRCCYDAPGVLRDDLFIEALRAWKTDVSEHILLQRLQLLQRLLKRSQWTKNLYYTLDKCISYEMEECRSSIRKVKKYSGYVRNSSSVGSKSSSAIYKPEPEIFEWCSDVGIDFYLFLTVGEYNSGTPGDVIFTLMSPERTKRKPKHQKND